MCRCPEKDPELICLKVLATDMSSPVLEYVGCPIERNAHNLLPRPQYPDGFRTRTSRKPTVFVIIAVAFRMAQIPP